LPRHGHLAHVHCLQYLSRHYGAQNKAMRRSKLRPGWKLLRCFLRGIQISCDNRPLMPHCRRRRVTDTWAPGLEAQPVIFFLAVPLPPKPLTPFVVPMPLYAWLQESLIEKSVGFRGEFEHARDRLGQRTSPSQRECFSTHARLCSPVQRRMRQGNATSCMHGTSGDKQVRNGSHGTRLLTTVYCMCMYQTSTLLGEVESGF
jgi:hypothetical protein